MTATDLGTMRRAVLLDPSDDLARLAFADACEEAGDIGRAEFVRVQVELDAFPWVHDLRRGEYDARDGVSPEWQRAFDLHDREMRLLWAGPSQWRANWVEWCWSESRDENGRPRRADRLGGMIITPHGSKGLGKDPQSCGVDTTRGTVRQVFRRGFVESVALPLAAFMEHAGELFSRHPIVSVTITDKEPSRLSSGAAVWLTCDRPGCNTSTCLPPALFRLFEVEAAGANYKRFATPELAYAALSAGCVAYGRRQAGLPPLPVHPPADTGGHGGGSPVAGAVQSL